MNEPLWTSAEAEAATGGRASAPFVVSGICIDSREAVAGDLFVALQDQRDGHDFVAAAHAAGASAALVSRVPDGLPDNFPLLVVDDTLNALEALGGAARALGPRRRVVTCEGDRRAPRLGDVHVRALEPREAS